MEILNRDSKYVWHPFTPLKGAPELIPLKSARGALLHTMDDRIIIDAVSSWWVNIHGHSHPAIAEAMYQQALTMEHVIFAGFTHEPAVKLAESVIGLLPEGQAKAFYSDDGSTSVEVGLKMAIQYWNNQGTPKKKVIAIDGAYHGDTFGAMAVGERGVFNEVFHPFLFDVDYVPFPTEANWEEVLQKFEQMVSDPEAGVFIFEPLVQGASGMRMYDSIKLNQLMRMARDHGLVLIADEVMTGFGRTGTWFATHQTEEKADIYCLSKGLTGGTLALGMTTCNQKIVEVFDSSDTSKTFFHGHSFTANPVACAAANASFELLTHPDCRKNLDRIIHHHEGFRKELVDHPKVRTVRQCGTIIAMEIDTSGETSYFNKSRNQIYDFFIQRGVLLRPLGNVVYILPPYVITDEELEKVYEAIREFLVKF